MNEIEKLQVASEMLECFIDFAIKKKSIIDKKILLKTILMKMENEK